MHYHVHHDTACTWTACTTGRQPPPLSSVLYGIISKRRYILAAQLLLREKSELALIALSLACLVAQWYLHGGSWKWVTILPSAYPSWDGPSVCYLFLHLFIWAPSTAFTWLSTFCTVHYISLVLFTFLRTPHGCRVSFLKGTYNFQNCLRW